MGALDHAQGQFGFGLKAQRLWDMSGLPTHSIVAPLLRDIQFAVDQAMAQGGDVGEENADLAVFHPSADPAILGLDACGVGAAFGKAAFIKDQNGKEGIGLSRGGGGRQQSLDQGGTQGIAYARFVPHGMGEQTLYAIGMSLASVFSDVPAIFPGNIAQEGLEVEQRVVAWFGASEAGGDALVQVAQGQGPAADLLEEGLQLRIGGRLKGSHAFLLADGTDSREFFLPLECHIQVRKARDLG